MSWPDWTRDYEVEPSLYAADYARLALLLGQDTAEGHRVAKDPEFNPRCLELILSGLAERGYQCVVPQPEQLRTRNAGK